MVLKGMIEKGSYNDDISFVVVKVRKPLLSLLTDFTGQISLGRSLLLLDSI